MPSAFDYRPQPVRQLPDDLTLPKAGPLTRDILIRMDLALQQILRDIRGAGIPTAGSTPSGITATATIETLNTKTAATAAPFVPAVSTVGYYLVSLSLTVRTAEAGKTASLSVNWTDRGGAQNGTIVLNVGTAVRQANRQFLVYLNSGSLTYTTAFPGFATGRVDVAAKAQMVG